MCEVRENGVYNGNSGKQWHAIYPWILQSTSYWRNQVPCIRTYAHALGELDNFSIQWSVLLCSVILEWWSCLPLLILISMSLWSVDVCLQRFLYAWRWSKLCRIFQRNAKWGWSLYSIKIWVEKCCKRCLKQVTVSAIYYVLSNLCRLYLGLSAKV